MSPAGIYLGRERALHVNLPGETPGDDGKVGEAVPHLVYAPVDCLISV